MMPRLLRQNDAEDEAVDQFLRVARRLARRRSWTTQAPARTTPTAAAAASVPTTTVAAISTPFIAVDEEAFGLFDFATTTPIRGKSTF